MKDLSTVDCNQYIYIYTKSFCGGGVQCDRIIRKGSDQIDGDTACSNSCAVLIQVLVVT